MCARRTTHSAPLRDATSGWLTSRRRTSSSRTTTWCSSGVRTSAGCSSDSRRRASTSSPASGSTTSPGAESAGAFVASRARSTSRTACSCTGSARHGARSTAYRVYDVVHQFFVASVERLGPAPWDAELNLSEHYELFLSLKERGLRCTRLPDVVVEHRQELPPAYQGIREDTRRYDLALAREARAARSARGRRAVPRDGHSPLPPARNRRVHGASRLARRHAAAPGAPTAGLTRSSFGTDPTLTGVRCRS